jgi:hypothetical protein
VDREGMLNLKSLYAILKILAVGYNKNLVAAAEKRVL